MQLRIRYVCLCGIQDLLGDRTVKESDVKDLVGDGIRYLHERHR
jgi:hypothetical protein